MTVFIPAKTPSSITAYHHTLNGEKGFMVQVQGSVPVFITEKEADKIGRYLLFDNPSEPLDIPDEKPQTE